MNGSEDEDTQESDNDTENDSEETDSSSPETSSTIHSENLCEHCENSNVYGTLIMKCPKCFWHDYYKSRVQYAITRSPRREITSKRAFFGVTIVEQLHTKKRRRWKPIFISLLKRRTKKRINFSFLSNRCVFDPFCHWFSIKVFKHGISWFYCENQLICPCFN